MIAMTAGGPHLARHARKVAMVVAVMGTLTVSTGCIDDKGGPSNQTTGTVLGATFGAAVGGLAFNSVGGAVGGALIGALAGNLVGRALDDQERRRLAEATERAFVAETNQPTTYTVEPTKPASASGSMTATNTPTGSAQPTIVSAKPVGPAAPKADGSTCRPIELTATKNGQTTTETTTFCQAAGSKELKPLAV